ncbi:L-rhamnose mutarotase [Ferrovibrio terrae]|uniref:L-rhamnose mutarotase n=1 Tax=Ferrovibrio terrae TaxID=2594003 RepID=UPI00313804DA
MRRAFVMRLNPGNEHEYRRRHDEIWPELTGLLRQSGISNYSIFLEADSGKLFAVLEVAESNTVDALPDHPIMRRWWDYMKDIMETNPDGSPVAIPLREVFRLD